jgi:hypothetical protein
MELRAKDIEAGIEHLTPAGERDRDRDILLRGAKKHG